jgi:7-carboxy-7-deazaguanine synthase
MKLKISELFYSLQGEGRYVGTPSIFLRTFGCNFTCGGFGMPKGEVSQERKVIGASHKLVPFASYQSLPLVATGCDSYASWDPAFKSLSPHYTTEELSNMMDDLLPSKDWGNTHLVITGGEPLLGWQKVFPELLDRLYRNGLEYLTFETNGTQVLTPEFSKYLREEFLGEIAFSVSTKLAVSGETYEDAVKPEAIDSYLNVVLRNEFTWAKSQVYLKFVVDSDEDLAQIDRIRKENPTTYGSRHVDVYLMPVGGTGDLYYKNNVKVANEALKRGWKYSPRLQVDIWKNAWGT